MSASSEAGNIALPNGPPFDLHEAMTLFRFNREKEALSRLDAAVQIVTGPWRWRIPPDRRKDLIGAVEAFRNCIATTRPAAMSTLTVRTFVIDPAVRRRRSPRGGARLTVEDRPVGQTRFDGILTVRVPSGEIRVNAEIPRTIWGEGYSNLLPRRSGTLSIVMDEGKEVAEDTDLVLAEAVDDILPATAASFTLKFVRNGQHAPVARIEGIDLLNRHEDMERTLDELFTVVNGSISATKPAQVLDALSGHLEETITFSVHAADAAGFSHTGRVRFRIGQSRLLVTLSPPPSNPSLPVSNIEVGVSLMGAGIAVQRVSDANGRFEIDSFPHGTIAFDSVTTSAGTYYYGQATMAHKGSRSVTLVLRHVSDVVKGVPPLTINEAARPVR